MLFTPCKPDIVIRLGNLSQSTTPCVRRGRIGLEFPVAIPTSCRVSVVAFHHHNQRSSFVTRYLNGMSPFKPLVAKSSDWPTGTIHLEVCVQ